MSVGVTCVVPARLGSTRFFGKLLTPILGKPVIVHTMERAKGAGVFDRVVCVTDSQEIGELVASQGFEWVLSDSRRGDAANGTERIARALGRIDADLIVNLQGDEPAFPEEGLRTLSAALQAEPEAVHILVHEDEPSAEDLANPNRVKVALQSCGAFAGFVRTVPAGARPEAYRLQLGAYAYSRAYLEQYAALPPSVDEIALSHEMLRAPGLATLRAHPSRPGASVDVEDDLIAARAALEALGPATHAPRTARGTTPPTFFQTNPTEEEPQTTLQGASA
jgi:3-deoxy-manno-octulosonate cytidylyltransferase (CMP-KDO synthetase)